MADGLDLVAKAEVGGVDVAEELVRQGHLPLQYLLDLSQVELGSVHLPENLEVVQLKPGNVLVGEDHRPDEVVALKVGTSGLQCLLILFVVPDVRCQQARLSEPPAPRELLQLVGRHVLDVDADHVGHGCQGRVLVGVDRRIERQEAASCLELPARLHDLRLEIGRLRHGVDFAIRAFLSGRVEGITCHVHERSPTSRDRLYAGQPQALAALERRSCGEILAEKLAQTAPEQQLVGEDAPLAVENGLSRNEDCHTVPRC